MESNNKLRVFKYENGYAHVHDSIPEYRNVTPFSEDGVSEWCDLTDNPEEADLFLMGQWPRGSQLNIKDFEHFEKYKEKHFIDLEGEGGLDIPEFLWQSIVSVNGPPSHYASKVKNVFVRPTFSKLFVDLCRNRFEDIEHSNDRSVGFKGFINCQTRYDMFMHLGNQPNILDSTLEANPTWNGPAEVGSEIQEEYIARLKKHAFTLCPRGSGVDSVRLLEACYYGRIPILISDFDYELVDHLQSDTSFVRKVIWDGSVNLATIIKDIVSVDDSVIEEDQRRAKSYFENTLREYMNDPTLYVCKWLKNQGVV